MGIAAPKVKANICALDLSEAVFVIRCISSTGWITDASYLRIECVEASAARCSGTDFGRSMAR